MVNTTLRKREHRAGVAGCEGASSSRSQAQAEDWAKLKMGERSSDAVG